MRIPAFDLSRQHAELFDELQAASADVLRSGRFILGERVERLETEIAAVCGAQFGIGVASGSDALYLALLAAEIGPGDEVITTPFTFFATAGAIERVGARPGFVDIDPLTYNLDPERVRAACTDKTKVLLPVHLYGQPADMAPLMEIAEHRGLVLIEDAAQAIGAEYRRQRVGSFGSIGILSFYPTKNLGGCGDGGMLVTSDPDLADRLRMLRVHGSKRRYYHLLPGINSRLDELQATFLLMKLPHLDGWTSRRRQVAALYNSLLQDLPVTVPLERPDVRHVYHQYTIATPDRDDLRAYLSSVGIGTEIYYPLGLHLQEALGAFGYKRGAFPVAERMADQVLSLPMFPELTDDEVQEVAANVRSFFAGVS